MAELNMNVYEIIERTGFLEYVENKLIGSEIFRLVYPTRQEGYHFKILEFDKQFGFVTAENLVDNEILKFKLKELNSWHFFENEERTKKVFSEFKLIETILMLYKMIWEVNLVISEL